MEKPQSIPTSALSTISEQLAFSFEKVVRERMARLAELIRRDGAAYPLTAVQVRIWVDVFTHANVSLKRVDAAFDRAETHLKFWPTPAEVLGFISAAEDNSAEEKAAQKWQEVLDYIRLYYHPDLGTKSGPRIVERTRRAINAAGGLQYISECLGDDLVFARKRFIESYLRWDELEQDKFLLPEGEVKRLLADTAKTMTVERLLEHTKAIEPAPKPTQGKGAKNLT